jgi:hypothetical protein
MASAAGSRRVADRRRRPVRTDGVASDERLIRPPSQTWRTFPTNHLAAARQGIPCPIVRRQLSPWIYLRCRQSHAMARHSSRVRAVDTLARFAAPRRPSRAHVGGRGAARVLRRPSGAGLSTQPRAGSSARSRAPRCSKGILPGHLPAGPADKGIIITTGSFTSEARKAAVRHGVPAIELADGEKLVTMLEGLELGLKPRRTFEGARLARSRTRSTQGGP